jgi:hypothetical protein
LSPKSSDSGASKGNWITWVTFGIALFSFGMSVANFWLQSMKPGDIKVSIGSDLTVHTIRPSGHPPPVPEAKEMQGTLVIFATFTFANNGARVGEINALRLVFEAEDGTRFVYAPRWIVDQSKLNSQVALDTPGEINWDAITSAFFHSVLLPGKQIVSYNYVLFPDSSQGGLPPAPHKYDVTLRSLSAGETELRTQQSSTLDLTPAIVQLIPQGKIVNIEFEEVKRVIQNSK